MTEEIGQKDVKSDMSQTQMGRDSDSRGDKKSDNLDRQVVTLREGNCSFATIRPLQACEDGHMRLQKIPEYLV